MSQQSQPTTNPLLSRYDQTKLWAVWQFELILGISLNTRVERGKTNSKFAFLKGGSDLSNRLSTFIHHRYFDRRLYVRSTPPAVGAEGSREGSREKLGQSQALDPFPPKAGEEKAQSVAGAKGRPPLRSRACRSPRVGRSSPSFPSRTPLPFWGGF